MEENKRLTLKTKSKDTTQNYKQKSLFLMHKDNQNKNHHELEYT